MVEVLFLSSLKLCPSCLQGCCGEQLLSPYWLLLRNKLHIKHAGAVADDLPSPLPFFQGGQHCWSVFFFFFPADTAYFIYCRKQKYVLLGLLTSNHIRLYFYFIGLLVMKEQPPIVLSLLLYKLLNIANFSYSESDCS